MNGDHYQKLSLALMSVDAIQRQVKEQLDALYMEIAALIPEKEGRRRHTYTLAEARTMVKDACTREHGPSTRSGPHGTHRTKSHVHKKIIQLQVVGNKK